MQKGGIGGRTELDVILGKIPSSLKEMSGEQQVEFAELVAESCKDITKSRMRTIYFWVRKSRLDLMEKRRKGSQLSLEGLETIIGDVKRLKAKLAYLAGKSQGSRDDREMNNLYRILEKVIDAVKDEKDLEEFFAVVECILAYYRYYVEEGSRD